MNIAEFYALKRWEEVLFKFPEANFREATLNLGANLYKFRPFEVVRIQAVGSYTRIVLEGNKFLFFSCNIKKIENSLSGWGFVKIHRSHIINVLHIKEFHSIGKSFVILNDGTKIQIPRRKRKNTIEEITKYLFNIDRTLYLLNDQKPV